MCQHQKIPVTRNLSIDLFRGIAALGIILHHSISYNAAGYVPAYFVPITMLAEVPAFFFLSGATFYYLHDVKQYLCRLMKLAITYVIFSFFYTFFIALFDCFNTPQAFSPTAFLLDWFKMSIFRGTDHHFFTAVNASMWFMPLYFKVLLSYGLFLWAASYIAKKLTAYHPTLHHKRTLAILIAIAILFSAVFFLLLQAGFYIPLLQIQVLFYGLFLLLGCLLLPVTIKCLSSLLLLLLGNMLLFITVLTLYDGHFTKMISYKFPPHIIFFIFSFFFIIITLYLKQCPFTSRNILVKIGQNSLYIFFAQGFAVSLTGHLINPLTSPWPLKLLLTLLCNILITLLIATLLRTLILPPVRLITHSFSRLLTRPTQLH